MFRAKWVDHQPTTTFFAMFGVSLNSNCGNVD